MEKLANYINGYAQGPANGRYLATYFPASGAPKPTIPDSGASDIQAAVEAARTILPWWSARTPEQRAQVLQSIADRLTQAAEDLAVSEMMDQGMPLALAREFDIPRVIAAFRFFATRILHLEETAHPSAALGTLSYFSRMPLGICGIIGSTDHPLLSLAQKIAPALVCGNTLIVKAPLDCSGSAYLLGELFNEAGVPHGVVNFVFGGEAAEDTLASHSEIAAVSFLGSRARAQKILSFTAPSFKKTSLETHARNQALVMADADISEAVLSCVREGFQGGHLQEGFDIFVEKSAYEAFRDKFLRMTKFIRLGDPESRETQVGPLLSEKCRQNSLDYLAHAKDAGANLLSGGAVPAELKAGYFLSPAVLEGIQASDQQGLGPIVLLQSIASEKEAVDTLSADPVALFTTDLSRAHRLARSLKSSAVCINQFSLRNSALAMGGTRFLAYGLEGGEQSLDFFSARKVVELKI